MAIKKLDAELKAMNRKFKGSSAVTLEQLSLIQEERRKNLENMTSPMAKSAVFLSSWVDMNIRTEGGKVGGWVPFKAGGRWINQGGTRVLDTSAKLLRKTGRLASSFTPFHTGNNAGVFSDLPYAKVHNEGLGIVQRRILPERKEVRKEIKAILNGHISKSLGGRR